MKPQYFINIHTHSLLFFASCTYLWRGVFEEDAVRCGHKRLPQLLRNPWPASPWQQCICCCVIVSLLAPQTPDGFNTLNILVWSYVFILYSFVFVLCWCWSGVVVLLFPLFFSYVLISWPCFLCWCQNYYYYCFVIIFLIFSHVLLSSSCFRR